MSIEDVVGEESKRSRYEIARDIARTTSRGIKRVRDEFESQYRESLKPIVLALLTYAALC